MPATAKPFFFGHFPWRVEIVVFTVTWAVASWILRLTDHALLILSLFDECVKCPARCCWNLIHWYLRCNCFLRTPQIDTIPWLHDLCLRIPRAKGCSSLIAQIRYYGVVVRHRGIALYKQCWDHLSRGHSRAILLLWSRHMSLHRKNWLTHRSLLVWL